MKNECNSKSKQPQTSSLKKSKEEDLLQNIRKFRQQFRVKV